MVQFFCPPHLFERIVNFWTKFPSSYFSFAVEAEVINFIHLEKKNVWKYLLAELVEEGESEL